MPPAEAESGKAVVLPESAAFRSRPRFPSLYGSSTAYWSSGGSDFTRPLSLRKAAKRS